MKNMQERPPNDSQLLRAGPTADREQADQQQAARHPGVTRGKGLKRKQR